MGTETDPTGQEDFSAPGVRPTSGAEATPRSDASPDTDFGGTEQPSPAGEAAIGDETLDDGASPADGGLRPEHIKRAARHLLPRSRSAVAATRLRRSPHCVRSRSEGSRSPTWP